MKDVKTIPTTCLPQVLRLLTRFGVYVEEFAVSDSYIYIDTIPNLNKYKLDGNLTYIYTRSNPASSPLTSSSWIVRVKDERSHGLEASNYKIFRINSTFIKEIIDEVKKGNRKNYTLKKGFIPKTKGILTTTKAREAAYDKYRIATLEKLQYVIKSDTVVPMLKEQARKLQEYGLVAN